MKNWTGAVSIDVQKKDIVSRKKRHIKQTHCQQFL